MQEKDKPNSKCCYSLVFVFTPQLDKLVLLTNRIWLRSEGIVALVKIKALRHGGLLNGPGGRMHAFEVAHLAQVGSQALVKFLHDLVGVSFELLRAVLGKFGNCGLRRTPVTRPVLIKGIIYMSR